jgi:hypothetical protein
LDYSITLTYVEVYNETLIDLIGPTLQGNNVKGYQDEEGGIMSVQGKMSTSFCKPKRLPQVTIVEGNEGRHFFVNRLKNCKPTCSSRFC